MGVVKAKVGVASKIRARFARVLCTRTPLTKILDPPLVPFNLAPYLSRFLARDVNKAFAEVTGEKVNRKAGYGLEIPCVYRLYGPKAYVDKMKEMTDTMISSGLI